MCKKQDSFSLCVASLVGHIFRSAVTLCKNAVSHFRYKSLCTDALQAQNLIKDAMAFEESGSTSVENWLQSSPFCTEHVLGDLLIIPICTITYLLPFKPNQSIYDFCCRSLPMLAFCAVVSLQLLLKS